MKIALNLNKNIRNSWFTYFYNTKYIIIGYKRPQKLMLWVRGFILIQQFRSELVSFHCTKMSMQYLNWQEAKLHVKPTTCSANSASSMHCLECTLRKWVVSFDRTCYNNKNQVSIQKWILRFLISTMKSHKLEILKLCASKRERSFIKWSNLLNRRASPTATICGVLVMSLLPKTTKKYVHQIIAVIHN